MDIEHVVVAYLVEALCYKPESCRFSDDFGAVRRMNE
jgi:hypothetical protein